MSKISEIKKNLRYGDQQLIAKIAECSTELVKKVLNGQRNHKKGKGARVIQVAQKIIEARERMMRMRES